MTGGDDHGLVATLCGPVVRARVPSHGLALVHAQRHILRTLATVAVGVVRGLQAEDEEAIVGMIFAIAGPGHPLGTNHVLTKCLIYSICFFSSTLLQSHLCSYYLVSCVYENVYTATRCASGQINMKSSNHLRTNHCPLKRACGCASEHRGRSPV